MDRCSSLRQRTSRPAHVGRVIGRRAVILPILLTSEVFSNLRGLAPDTQPSPLLHTEHSSPHTPSGRRERLAPADRSLEPGRSHDPEMQPQGSMPLGHWGGQEGAVFVKRKTVAAAILNMTTR